MSFNVESWLIRMLNPQWTSYYGFHIGRQYGVYTVHILSSDLPDLLVFDAERFDQNVYCK